MAKQLIETTHHVVEFESKKVYKQVLGKCKELDISLDHYLFEFDLSENDQEWIESLTS
jgi:hypothetical protein